MISYKHEGQRAKQGLNLYSSTDPYSAGFVICIWRWVLSVRYSKIVKRWKVTSYLKGKGE
jgi:hypothetical protein